MIQAFCKIAEMIKSTKKCWWNVCLDTFEIVTISMHQLCQETLYFQVNFFHTLHFENRIIGASKNEYCKAKLVWYFFYNKK